jgi:hypothetical protein
MRGQREGDRGHAVGTHAGGAGSLRFSNDELPTKLKSS